METILLCKKSMATAIIPVVFAIPPAIIKSNKTRIKGESRVGISNQAA
jgi:hypothetical protein